MSPANELFFWSIIFQLKIDKSRGVQTKWKVSFGSSMTRIPYGLHNVSL